MIASNKTTLVGVTALLALFLGTVQTAQASEHCTVTLLSPGDIQAAVNAASAGDVICLDGTWTNPSTVTVATSGVTLTSADPSNPAVLSGGDGPAFRLAHGVSDAIFEALTIRDRTGWRGGGIEAWDRTTSNISVRNNRFRNNAYSAILVGSEGGYIHSNWAVARNEVQTPTVPTSPNWFALGIELTNCSGCSINRNTVSGGHIGILVQGRNSISGSGLVEIVGVNVSNNAVSDVARSAYGYGVGVYVLGLASEPVSPFDPITGAQSNLRGVTLGRNEIEAEARGVYVLGFLTGAVTDFSAVGNGIASKIGADVLGYGGQVTNASLVRNSIHCGSQSGSFGIRLLPLGGGQVTNTKLVRNSIWSCETDVGDEGTNTKEP